MTNNIENVINGNYCVGCGACAFISGNSMKLDKYGEYKPVFENLTNSNLKNLDLVCPSLSPNLNENVLAEKFLDSNSFQFDDKLGYHIENFVAHVNEFEIRKNGTSGGMGTWIGYELMALSLIDGIIHVRENDRKHPNDAFYKYSISKNLDVVKSRSKTKYHVMELSEVLNELKRIEGKFLIIGVPCFIKAIRRIQLIDDDIKNKIKYTVSLVCGHYKTVNWSISLGWSVGILPNQIKNIQYRTKGKNISARKYIFKVFSKIRNKIKIKDSSHVVGGKFNQGALMLPACEFCDDVTGETADLSIGDAWLPQFEYETEGKNLLIFRNKELLDIVKNASKQNRVFLKKINKDDAIKSQSGGFRQRREGLSFRLKQKEKQHKWVPIKRIKPGQFKVSYIRKLVYCLRTKSTYNSREYFIKALSLNNFNIYNNKMKPFLNLLRFVEIISNFKSYLKKFLRKFFG